MKQPSQANIVNPARLNYVDATNTCIQCHSQGQPLSNPIEGKYYDWPVGFRVGGKLGDFWELEEHKPGETTFTHFPDGTGHVFDEATPRTMRVGDRVSLAVEPSGVLVVPGDLSG